MTTSILAYEAAFPDGFVTSVNYVVPEELSDIAEKLGVSRNLVGINFRHPNVMPNFAVP